MTEAGAISSDLQICVPIRAWNENRIIDGVSVQPVMAVVTMLG